MKETHQPRRSYPRILQPFHYVFFAALLLVGVMPTMAQLSLTYDSSGNLTNVVTASSAAPSTFTSRGALTLFVGDRLSLSAVHTGKPPFTYQWTKNGTALSGATGNSYFNPAVTLTDAGTYSVIISNSSGTVTNQVQIVRVLPTKQMLYAIAHNGSRYVSVGTDGLVTSSTDLSSWSISTSFTTNTLESIVYGGGKYVAVGAGGTIITSTDGLSWSVQSSGNTNDLKGVTYGNSTFIAAGSQGTVLTSSDAVSWTTRTFDNVDLRAVAFGNSKFVTVGTSGTIWVSTSNGVGWNDYTWPTGVALNAVLYSNSKYIAVGEKGLVLRSSDAVTWTQSFTEPSSDFRSLAYLNNTYFAFGPLREAYISSDAIDWGSIPSGSFDVLTGAIAVGTTLVAVGDRGSIVNVFYNVADRFSVSNIPLAQRAGQTLTVTFNAQDAAGTTLTTYSGGINLTATGLVPAVSTNVLGNITASNQPPGSTNTYGYSFTPDKDLLVTHLRTYFGKQASIWTVEGELLVALPISATAGTWTLTGLVPGLRLEAGKTYVIGIYSESPFYYRTDGGFTFADGTLNQGLIASGLTMPWQAQETRWPLIDFQYSVERTQSLSVTPSSAILASGTASVGMQLSTPARNVVIKATDANGKVGFSNPFHVYASNDLAITSSDSKDPASPSETVSFVFTVVNPTAASATGVLFTNTLPSNITNVVATSTKGTATIASGKVTCNLGTMLAGTSETITITALPTSPGIVLTNTATVTKNETDSDLSNNVAVETTYVLPILSVSGGSILEGHTGSSEIGIQVMVLPPSPHAIWVDMTTVDGTAVAGLDYKKQNQKKALIFPGQLFWDIAVEIYGDTVGEPNETFNINFSNVKNAVLSTDQIQITITNDDDIANQVDAFAWDTIFTPKRVGTAFSSTIRAKDHLGTTVTSFGSTNTLRAVQIGGSVTNVLLTNAQPSHVWNEGTYTLGYAFKPSTDVFVTHFRQYSGGKAILWADEGYPVVTNSLSVTPGQWTETQLPTPILLKKNQTYRVSFWTAGQDYYGRLEAPIAFPNGTITGSYYALGDAFPDTVDNTSWYMVDLRYSLPASFTPTNTATFSSGVWTGNVTINDQGQFRLMADDNKGHIGYSNPFSVYNSNDMALVLTPSTSQPLVGTNFDYTVSIRNPGPNSSTLVRVTNTLPTEVSYIGLNASQGTATQSNGIISWDVGTIASLGSATLTITVHPDVAGSSITNSATVYRFESDANTQNNTATSVLQPTFAATLLYADGVDNSGLLWRSRGSAATIWQLQTNVTHDGVDALKSGAITHGQVTYLETAIRGPGTLKFWWKVSSETNGDRFYFYTNGFAMANITGTQDWQQFTYNVPAAYVTLIWGYVKDANISAGSDIAWLDQVEFTVPEFQFTPLPSFTNNLASLYLAGTNGQRLIIQGSQDLRTWTSLTTNVVTGGTISYTDSQATNYLNRFYRAIHRNEP
ncbi:MAG: immunoglobulin domain-containing protein [Verrucomicrobiales bacterium]